MKAVCTIAANPWCGKKSKNPQARLEQAHCRQNKTTAWPHADTHAHACLLKPPAAFSLPYRFTFDVGKPSIQVDKNVNCLDDRPESEQQSLPEIKCKFIIVGVNIFLKRKGQDISSNISRRQAFRRHTLSAHLPSAICAGQRAQHPSPFLHIPLEQTSCEHHGKMFAATFLGGLPERCLASTVFIIKSPTIASTPGM